MTALARIKPILLPAALFMAATTIYLGSLDGAFLFSWDDHRYVTVSPFLADGLSLSSFTDIWTRYYFAGYIPLTLLSYNLDYALWEFDPTGYHITNVLLHGLNTVLVFYALRRLVNNISVTVIAALLFAVHPLQVEVVAWISQRKSVLGMLFFLIAFLLHTHGGETRESILALIGGWIVFALAMLSKTSAIGAPLLFFLYDIEWRRMNPVKAAIRAVPYGLISLVAAYLQVQAHAAVGGIKEPLGNGLLDNVRLVLIVTGDYVASFLYPLNLNNRYYYAVSEFNSQWPALIGGILVISGLLTLAIRGGRIGRLSAAGIVMFMLPVSNIVPIAIQRADRYFYFPATFICLLVALLAVWLWERFYESEAVRYSVAAAIGGVVLASAVLTIQRVEVWSNSGTLWADHRTDYPTSSTGLINEGVYHYRTDAFPQAAVLFDELLERYPTNWKGYRFRGHIAYSDEDFALAADMYRQFLNVLPQSEAEAEAHTVYNNLGESLFNVGLQAHNIGDYATADDYYEQALTYLEDNAIIYNNIGFNAYVAGDVESAIAAYNQAIELDPDYLKAYNNLRTAAAAIGDAELVAFADENAARLAASEG
ncbi:MAG: tetratricopeptide repeat protein [Chloroflexota bacterium]